MNYQTQKTITINGHRLTAKIIRQASQSEANGGHNIACTPAGDIHWMDWEGEVKIFNAGVMRRHNLPYGAVVLFLV